MPFAIGGVVFGEVEGEDGGELQVSEEGLNCTLAKDAISVSLGEAIVRKEL